MNGTFTTNVVTQTLNNPLVVPAGGGPVGIHMDFRLDKSIQVTSGAITGQVDPTIEIRAVGPSDPGAYIDEFVAGVVNPTLTASRLRFRDRTAATSPST